MASDLSGHKYLEFLSASSAGELKEQLAQIKIPYRIISMYAVGTKHYVWFNPQFPNVKKRIKKKKKGINNEFNG